MQRKLESHHTIFNLTYHDYDSWYIPYKRHSIYIYRYVPDYLSLSHKKNLFHHLIIFKRIQEKVKLHTFIFTYVNIFAVKVINQKKKKKSVHIHEACNHCNYLTEYMIHCTFFLRRAYVRCTNIYTYRLRLSLTKSSWKSETRNIYAVMYMDILYSWIFTLTFKHFVCVYNTAYIDHGQAEW